ncbi:response regulator [bacterium]|nr:response regulator [bacterium]
MDSPSSDPASSRSSVLIVDDEPTNINILYSLLKEDYRTLVATNGKRAVELARSSRPPQLILLDIMMPEMDGYEVCKLLKEDPLTRHIPVLFTTAQNDPQEMARGFEVGAADYIHKPICPSILKARVNTHLLLARLLQHQPG